MNVSVLVLTPAYIDHAALTKMSLAVADQGQLAYVEYLKRRSKKVSL